MEPITTAVAPQSNPVIENLVDEGSNASTLDNLEANIENEIGSPTDQNAGVTQPPTTPATEEPPAATVPAVEETDAEAEAKTQRISQDNANLRATLTKIGIDPDSDTAEQLRAGLITLDDVVRARAPVTPQTTVSDAPAPELPLDQRLSNLQSTLASQKDGEVTAGQYRETQGKMLEVITGLVQANQNIVKEQEVNTQNQRVQGMIDAASDIFSKEVLVNVPEDVREIATEMFLGATDIEHVALRRQHGDNAETPEYFKHTATKVAPKFNTLIQSIYKAGQQSITAGGVPKPGVINPIPPGVGAGTPAPPVPKGKFSDNNLDANVDEYLAQTQARV